MELWFSPSLAGAEYALKIKRSASRIAEQHDCFGASTG
jgi:hypothetical protein